MIAPPTTEEINCAFQEAQLIYPSIIGIIPRILLVPHAGIHESRVVTAATLSYLSSSSGEIILLGTNHRNIRLPSDITFIEDDSIEHSLSINNAFLRYLNKSCSMTLLDQDANINSVAASLTNWLNSNPNNILIVSSDLSHYNNNQEQDNTNEDLLIQGLINSDINMVSSALQYVSACGKTVLQVATLVANMLQYKGAILNQSEPLYKGFVTCYNDSRNKRFGWSTTNGSSEVSYLGMIWKNTNIDTISSFDQQYLVAFAKSCIMATMTSSPIPKLPLWSIWNTINNGIFVGIKDKNGKVRASIGHYQTSEQNIVYNTMKSSIGTVGDANSRWKAPLNISEIDTYTYYINILQDKSEWKTYLPTDLINRIAPGDNYGFYLKIGNLGATFLPSVWYDLNISFEELMTELTLKAGGNGQEWRNGNATIQLYFTQYVELLTPKMC